MQAQNAGCVAFLHKPMHAKLLIAGIEAAGAVRGQSRIIQAGRRRGAA